VVGDFNSIRRIDERRNAGIEVDHKREMRSFNNFIEITELVDIPMLGRKFTLYKPNGLIKSRIDHILVSREWLIMWPHSKYHVLDKSVSDQCALVLKIVSTDWGLKPFRSLDIWQKDGRFLDFVRAK